MKIAAAVASIVAIMLGVVLLMVVLREPTPAQVTTPTRAESSEVVEAKKCKTEALGQEHLRTRLNNLLLCADRYKGTVTLEEVTLLNSAILLQVTTPEKPAEKK